MRGQQPGASVDYAIGGLEERRALVGADSPTVEHHVPGSELQAVATVDTPENDVAPGRQLGGDDVHHPGLAAAGGTGHQHVLAKQGDLNGAATAERTKMDGVGDALPGGDPPPDGGGEGVVVDDADQAAVGSIGVRRNVDGSRRSLECAFKTWQVANDVGDRVARAKREGERVSVVVRL